MADRGKRPIQEEQEDAFSFKKANTNQLRMSPTLGGSSSDPRNSRQGSNLINSSSCPIRGLSSITDFPSYGQGSKESSTLFQKMVSDDDIGRVVNKFQLGSVPEEKEQLVLDDQMEDADNQGLSLICLDDDLPVSGLPVIQTPATASVLLVVPETAGLPPLAPRRKRGPYRKALTPDQIEELNKQP